MSKVQEIKNRVTMWDVLAKYGFEQKKRMKCPLHSGDDLNFAVKDNSYMCFSHCGGGDVITFVQKLFGLTFTDALKKIDADFGLNLFGNRLFEELRKSYYQEKQMQAEKQRKEEEKSKAFDDYFKAVDELKRLEENKRKYAPTSVGDDFNELYIEAILNIAHQEYLVDCLAERLARND